MILLIVKLIIVALIGITIFKEAKAKNVDNSIEFRFNTRSWFEFVFVVVLDLFILSSNPSEEREIMYIFIGQAMIVLTFLHTKRYIFLGKKALYMLEHPFYVKDVQNVYYERGTLYLTIRNTDTKLYLPVGDVGYILERFAGKRFQK